jgi:hypothetical protein
MAGEPTPKTARKKKRRRPLRDEFIAYVVEFTGWDWGYPAKAGPRCGSRRPSRRLDFPSGCDHDTFNLRLISAWRRQMAKSGK